MNETNPTDPADTAAKPKAPTESATAPGALDGAKQKLASLAEKAKEHDFKGDAHKAAEGVKNLAENLKQRDFKEDARKAAEGVKNLKESLKTHDFKAELRDAFAETKKNPASIWKKPETLRPGKDLAVVGLAASVVLLLLLLVTSSSFLGLVCLVLGLGALLFSALGLKTEGRKLAVGGSVVGLLVLLCALGQTFGSSEGGDATDGEQAVASNDEDGTKAQTDKETASKTDTAPQKKKAAPMVGSKPKDYPVLVANEGKKTGKAEKIIAKADENASKLNSLNFFGFHTGMSLADFKTLREHYGLTKDQLWGYFNVENGEVYRMCFTTKALDKVTGWPNNFDTVELQMLEYFGIVEWNNIKEVIEGEIDSIFQSDEERLLFGEKGNVPRQYRTADGVVAKLFPKGWDNAAREVFDLLDTERQKTAAPIFRRFEQKNRMRNRLQELADQGIKVKMLQLPTGYEWLLREFDDGVWISAFPMTRDEFTWLFYETEYEKLSRKIDAIQANRIEKDLRTGNLFAGTFNALPAETKGSVVRFREPFPEEMKKAFESGIVDEKKYKEGYVTLKGTVKAFEDRAYPAVIVADEASSGQLERTAMFVVHGVASMEKAAWEGYKNARNNLIRAGKSDSELAALGYGMDAKEWSEKCKGQAVRDYVEENGGVIANSLTFFPTKLSEEDVARLKELKKKNEAKRKAEQDAKNAKSALDYALHQRGYASFFVKDRKTDSIIQNAEGCIQELNESVLPKTRAEAKKIKRDQYYQMLFEEYQRNNYMKESLQKLYDPLPNGDTPYRRLISHKEALKKQLTEFTKKVNELTPEEKSRRAYGERLRADGNDELSQTWLSAADAYAETLKTYNDAIERINKTLKRIDALERELYYGKTEQE